MSIIKKIKWEKYHLSIKVILIIIIPLAIVLGVTNYLLYDEATYYEEFDKVGTYDRVPDANNTLDKILSFFKGEKDVINETNFTEEETSHLYDVKTLIGGMTLFFYILVFFKFLLFGIIIFTSKKAVNDLIHITLGSAALTITYPIMLANLNFSYLFTEFHQLFFPQGGWMFDESSLLIQLFPQEFFFNFTKVIIYNSIFIGGFLLSFSFILWWVTRKAPVTRI